MKISIITRPYELCTDNLTMVALLTINSFLFPFPHQIIGGLDVLLNLIVISYFDSFSDQFKMIKGNFPAVLINHRNLRDRHKVFQVAHENRDCTQGERN